MSPGAPDRLTWIKTGGARPAPCSLHRKAENIVAFQTFSGPTPED